MKSTVSATIAIRHAMGAVCILGTLSFVGIAHADPAASLVSIAATATVVQNADVNDIASWADVPVNQRIPVTKATFDINGYLLTDNTGQVIGVPFENRNTYIMQFGVSPDGSAYFVNAGGIPVLYLSTSDYLTNSDYGTIWYPFSTSFQPTTPVYLSMAPRWIGYTRMGWYPGMVFTGGYWSATPVTERGTPSSGVSYLIDGKYYNDWRSFLQYVKANPPQNTYQHTEYVGIPTSGIWRADQPPVQNGDPSVGYIIQPGVPGTGRIPGRGNGHRRRGGGSGVIVGSPVVGNYPGGGGAYMLQPGAPVRVNSPAAGGRRPKPHPIRGTPSAGSIPRPRPK